MTACERPWNPQPHKELQATENYRRRAGNWRRWPFPGKSTLVGCPMPMVSPKKIQTSNIIRICKALSEDVCAHINIYMCAVTTDEKREALSLEGVGRCLQEGLGGRKEREKCCN